MNPLRQITLVLSRWVDDVASAILSIVSALRPTRKFQVVEQEDSAFVVNALRRRSARPIAEAPIRFIEGKFVEDAGARTLSRLAGGQVEIILARRRFAFRFLELPGQASGFLDAIIRSQIDRLTPWSSTQAAFGCDPPKETSKGRIGVVVAATARSALMPFVTALEAFRPNSIVVSTASEAGGDERGTTVFSQATNRELSIQRLRRFLMAAPAVAGLAAIASFAVGLQVGADLEDSRLQISRQMNERRAAISNESAGVSQVATAKLTQKKRESPATVIVLESLSQALPDDTYLTELHVADGKLEITGVTHEAASLIRIIEQTEQFRNATFFAPTTRAPLEAGEQFHIEARILPYSGVSMSLATLTTLGPFRRRWLSLLIYLIVLVGLIGGAVDALSSLLDSYAALDKNRAILDRLDRQTKRTTQRQGEPDGADNGPPFLIGKTITIAGAGLQERVESAVKKAGGNVLSSQIDLQGPRSAEGFVGLTESLEIGQAALQPLLYDLEAGMPYLFVENLAIQAPQAFGEEEGTPMRVLMQVSGQWQEPQ